MAGIDLKPIAPSRGPAAWWASLPPDDETAPSTAERIRFLVLAVAPWVVLYEITVRLHLPGRAFQFKFEDVFPIYPWTAIVYQSIYIAVAAAPWLARTRRDLRRLTISVWVSLAVVFPIYWLMPSSAPRRALSVTNWVTRVLQWERDTYPPTAALPSFHVLWVIFLARILRPAWLGAAYAVCVTLSCISTGMHYIPDVIASLVVAPFLMDPPRVWRRLRRF